MEGIPEESSADTWNDQELTTVLVVPLWGRELV